MSSWLIIGTILITLLLVVPFFLMKPTEMASDNPTGNDVVKWNDEIKDTFPTEVYIMPFIVEAKEGDMLTRKNLYELYHNEQALRESNLSPYLYLFDDKRRRRRHKINYVTISRP